MMTIPFLTIPASSKNNIVSLCSRLRLNDSFSFHEILLLMTQTSMSSGSFSILDAAAVSFLSSGTLKCTIPGDSEQLTFIHQSLTKQKVTALFHMEVRAPRT